MFKPKAILLASLLTACVAGILTPVLAQQGGGGGPATQPTTGPGAGGRGGRGGGAPGMTGAERDAFVGVTTKNTYTPIDTKDAQGNVVHHDPVGVTPIPDNIRADYRIDPFYTKMLTINGIVVLGSPRVSDYAFLECAYTMDHQFHDSPQWVRDMFAPLKIRLCILSVLEFTMDLPENNSRGQNSALADALFQDGRSRGLGGMPWCSCAEENLLNLQGDRYGGQNGLQGSGENITIHEFSHTTASAIGVVQGRAASTTTQGQARAGGGGGRGRPSGPFWDALNKALADSNSPGDDTHPPGRCYVWNHPASGRVLNVYGSTNTQEYWAEGAQAWFDNANPNNSGGLSVRNDVKTKDPELAALLKEIYGDGEWRYFKTTAKNPDGTFMRPAAELAHLAGSYELRGNKIPNFNNNNSPRVQAAATQPNLARRGGGGGGGGGAGGARRGGGTQPATGASTLPANAD